MQPAACRELVAAYLDWLRSKITVAEIEGVCEITTPFLDLHNDYLQIYVKQTDNGLLLTDDGYTLQDLALSGCDVNSPRRKQLLTNILSGFGVRQDGEELVAQGGLQTFPQKKHALLQAMLAVNDMFMTGRAHVASLFFEDIERFLRAHKIRFVPNSQFTGKSGFVHTFSFVIPASDSKPERILRAINQPHRNSITSFLFAWNDSREVRPPKSAGYAVLNDTEKKPGPDVISALKQYGAVDLLWSKRDDYVEQLVA